MMVSGPKPCCAVAVAEGCVESSQCQDWVPWKRAFSVQSIGGNWMVEYVCFVVFSVSCPHHAPIKCTDHVEVFFAACASVLVKNFSIYAKHSGIPEIKTVLGGFVMRRFMDTWTLVVKSLGLVSLFSLSSRTLLMSYSVWL